MKNSILGSLSKFHLWIDISLLNFAYFIAGTILFGSLSELQRNEYLNILLLANLVWVLCIYLFNLYSFVPSTYFSYNYLGKLIIVCSTHFLIIEVILSLNQNSGGLNGNLVFTSFEIFAASILFVHFAIKTGLGYLNSSGFNSKRYAVLGNGDISAWMNGFYKDHQKLGYHYCGTFSHNSSQHEIDVLENFIENERLDYIYCFLSEINKEHLDQVLRLAERKKTQVRLIPDFKGLEVATFDFVVPGSYPVINVDTKPFSGLNEQIIKRTFDLAFASTVMLLGMPIFLLVMIAVKLSSKGPIFFLQDRTGRWGKTFKIIKFRTMHTDAEKYSLQHSLGNKDPRITPIGYYLRKSRLDELPQFLNVLMGDMSVVGPRPLHKYDVDMLMKEASHDFQRMLTIRPGITSIGQIKVGYATNAIENLLRLKYDMVYLNTYSLATDIYLIVLTIQVVLLGKGK